MSKPGSMREVMPSVAQTIDELRAAFGADEIDGQIRRGMKGEPVFHAQEGGHQVGTPIKYAAVFPALPSPSWHKEIK